MMSRRIIMILEDDVTVNYKIFTKVLKKVWGLMLGI